MKRNPRLRTFPEPKRAGKGRGGIVGEAERDFSKAQSGPFMKIGRRKLGFLFHPWRRICRWKRLKTAWYISKTAGFVKILGLNPVNFPLRSESEKRNIIYSYAFFLKISPVKLHIKVLSKRVDVNRHLDSVRLAYRKVKRFPRWRPLRRGARRSKTCSSEFAKKTPVCREQF